MQWCNCQKKIHVIIINVFLFIVLFAKNCTSQIKSDYLNSHGEEAQEKPPGLYGMGSLRSRLPGASICAVPLSQPFPTKNYF